MSAILKTLLEQRDTAKKAFEDFATPLVAENRNLTTEEDEKRTELRSRLSELNARILELEEDARTEDSLTEARRRAGIDTIITNIKEPRTYEEGSPNSYVADFVRSSGQHWKGYHEACQRLARHSYEVSVEMATGSDEGKRARKLVKESRRTEAGSEARDVIKEMEERGRAGMSSETRTGMDTTAGSGGALVTPQYFVGDYAPYREAGRAFVDQCNSQPLPDYGMTVYLPHVTGPAGVASQSTQNTGVNETDPTAGYLSANLVTEAGQVQISQQLLDRAGPNFAFDKLVFDQLKRDFDPKVDTYILTQALAAAGAITYTAASFVLAGTSGTGPSFYSKISGGKAAIRTGAGVVMNPTHIFLQPARWEYISAWGDANGRPVVVPNYAGVFNAVAGGNASGDTNYEGDTGYRMNGLPVFQDLNIPTPGTGADQAIVGALSEVYVWEGDPVMRTIPQTFAQNLSVLLQLYAYVATIPRYPTAIQSVSGTGMAAIAF